MFIIDRACLSPAPRHVFFILFFVSFSKYEIFGGKALKDFHSMSCVAQIMGWLNDQTFTCEARCWMKMFDLDQTQEDKTVGVMIKCDL